MMVHQIILTKKPKPKTTMKKIIQNIKRKVILISFCINMMLCFASCAYFSAAEAKMQEVRGIQRDAKEVLEMPDLTGEWNIEELENAVAKDLRDVEIKHKRKQVRQMVAKH